MKDFTAEINEADSRFPINIKINGRIVVMADWELDPESYGQMPVLSNGTPEAAVFNAEFHPEHVFIVFGALDDEMRIGDKYHRNVIAKTFDAAVKFASR